MATNILTDSAPMEDTAVHPSSIPRVHDMQAILQKSNSWDQCWLEKVTPWDLGTVTPVIAELVEKDDLPLGRALVPGCGSGYDVFALASPQRHVTGLDISPTAMNRASQILEAYTKVADNPSFVEFICADFFSYEPSTHFDLIFDYTFFCALEPKWRSQWASKMAELLSTDGELITLIFPVGDFEGGPPFAVSLEAYEEVLHPHGIECVVFQENNLAVERRKGKEFLGRWKRKQITVTNEEENN